MRTALTIGAMVVFGVGVAMAQGGAPATPPAEPTVVKVGDTAPDFASREPTARRTSCRTIAERRRSS